MSCNRWSSGTLGTTAKPGHWQFSDLGFSKSACDSLVLPLFRTATFCFDPFWSPRFRPKVLPDPLPLCCARAGVDGSVARNLIALCRPKQIRLSFSTKYQRYLILVNIEASYKKGLIDCFLNRFKVLHFCFLSFLLF